MNVKKQKTINWVVIILFSLVIIKLAMVVGDYSSKKEAELDFVVKLNVEGDFPNPKEGTAILNLRLLMDQIISQANRVPKYVIFVESKTIPGLVLRYNVHDSVIEGGLPMMQSEEVVFLDNNMHEVVYTFKKGAEQKIYFDKIEVASGSFNPRRIGIIGAVAYELEEYEIINVPVDGSVEILDKAR